MWFPVFHLQVTGDVLTDNWKEKSHRLYFFIVSMTGASSNKVRSEDNRNNPSSCIYKKTRYYLSSSIILGSTVEFMLFSTSPVSTRCFSGFSYADAECFVWMWGSTAAPKDWHRCRGIGRENLNQQWHTVYLHIWNSNINDIFLLLNWMETVDCYRVDIFGLSVNHYRSR